jgi:predicted ATPase
MIKKITVQNFFSFGAEQTIELNADTNILVGINGTGKSNFIKAIRLLQEGIKGNFEKLFSQKWGGFSGSCNFINPYANEIKISYHFDGKVVEKNAMMTRGLIANFLVYTIIINKYGALNYELFEQLNQYDNEYSVPLKIEIDKSENYNSHELGLSYLKDFYQDPTAYFLKLAIERIIIYDYFDTSFDGNLRQLSPYYSENKLLSDGRNLTALLSSLNGNSVKTYDKIIEELKNVNPNFKDLVFTTPLAGKSLMSLKEKNLDRAITIEHISDGTLRYLLLLSIFYNPNRGSVVCIDEPEAGLHPDMINGIAKGIKYAAQNGTQMIIATHSPLLLNAFELEDLKIFEKDADNQTIVKTKSEEDFPDWQGEFLAGQMWLRGEIGGVRW